jgi:hypothetical protein
MVRLSSSQESLESVIGIDEVVRAEVVQERSTDKETE